MTVLEFQTITVRR